MSAEDYHADFFDPPEPQDTDIDWDAYAIGRKEVTEAMKTGYRPGDGAALAQSHNAEQIKANRFYVGHPRIFRDNWGHPTIEEATQHAKDLLEDHDRQETFIVQIVRVVTRRPTPLVVKEVGGRTNETTKAGARRKTSRKRKLQRTRSSSRRGGSGGVGNKQKLRGR